MRRETLAALLLSAALATAVHAQEAEPKRILVFGDSLTWGWTPSEPIVPTTRHPEADRWTSAMARALGDGYEIVVEGLSGRTTNADDPNDSKLKGDDYLPAALASHEPLDLVIVMLGTNDTKAYLDRTPLEIGLGAGQLINMVHESPGWDLTDYPTPTVLLISPPPLAEAIDPAAAADFEGAREKTLALPEVYGAIAAAAGENFFDAGTVIETDGVDGIHFTAATNATLGEAVAAEVERIIGP
ncbi:MAG: SGNH/GDSL hydrolase family protein [Rhodobacteraceae bacterium]|nr:SGNH/GDSL hydrolase family protein [Paracoccaceae bacterium]